MLTIQKDTVESHVAEELNQSRRGGVWRNQRGRLAALSFAFNVFGT